MFLSKKESFFQFNPTGSGGSDLNIFQKKNNKFFETFIFQKFFFLKNHIKTFYFLYFFTKKAVHNINCTEPGTIPHCGFTCYLFRLETCPDLLLTYAKSTSKSDLHSGIS